jgi:tetratricopeptide (TPR) repeat protein
MRGIFKPYYYGEHKWDNYLIDIQNSVETNTKETTNAFQKLGEQQLAELRGHTEAMGILQDTLHAGLEELKAEFEWGFTLLADQMDRQVQAILHVATRLDEIHKTLQFPLMTQARELFLLGEDRLHKKLLDKALEAFRQAEQKNEVDFLLQLQMGKLLLYGKDEDDDVIDLREAERHLLLAARYADAEKHSFQNWNKYCGEAYFHAAVSAYLLGEGEKLASNGEGVRDCLARALRYLHKSAGIWPEFLETVYTKAKCHALLGERDEALRNFEILADRDRRYSLKATEDKDFDAIRAEVDGVFHRSLVSPGSFARATTVNIAKTAEALEWAKRSKSNVRDAAATERLLDDAKIAMAGTNVDIVSLAAKIDQARDEFVDLADRTYSDRMTTLQNALKEAQDRKTRLQSSLAAYTAHRGGIKGDADTSRGFGCLTSFVFFIIGLVFLGNVQGEGALIFYGMIVTWTIGFAVAKRISWQKKTRPVDQQIAEAKQGISECDGLIPSLKEQVFQLETEFGHFKAWRRDCMRVPAA